MPRIRILAVGLGPIGLAAVRLVLGRRTLELAGAVDVDRDKRGKDLAELLGRPTPTGILVADDAEAAYARLAPDAVLLCTSSFLPAVREQVLLAVRHGADVVSSCEEMLLPDFQHPELAAELDRAARQGGATVVGTGVNPGFVLDFMPVVASAVCSEVRRVRARRVVDASTRRLPLQKKVGAGMAEAEFRSLVAAGRLGHVGLRESVALVGRAFGFELDEVSQTVEPVLATEERRTPHLAVPAGRVAGIRNVGVGRRGGEALVELELEMYVGAPDAGDEILLEGDPDVRVRFAGGVPGDEATAAILVNTVPRAVEAAPGLRTVLDLAPARLVR